MRAIEPAVVFFKLACQFDPQKIILFGSHAWGTPHAHSDVDLFVVMPTRNELGQALKIRLAFPAPFAMDLLVRTPEKLQARLKEGDSFTTEIMTKGRHDPCVGIRGAPVVEAMVALVLADQKLLHRAQCG